MKLGLFACSKKGAGRKAAVGKRRSSEQRRGVQGCGCLRLMAVVLPVLGGDQHEQGFVHFFVRFAALCLSVSLSL